jgi:hypothetical protein
MGVLLIASRNSIKKTSRSVSGTSIVTNHIGSNSTGNTLIGPQRIMTKASVANTDFAAEDGNRLMGMIKIAASINANPAKTLRHKVHDSSG